MFDLNFLAQEGSPVEPVFGVQTYAINPVLFVPVILVAVGMLFFFAWSKARSRRGPNV